MIVISSVSCLYGIGNPADFHEQTVHIKRGEQRSMTRFLYQLVDALYSRTETDFKRGTFRVRGDTVDICIGYGENAVRIEFFGDEVDRISEFVPLTGEKLRVLNHAALYPASHYIIPPDKLAEGIARINAECDERVKEFTAEGKLIEAQRIEERTRYDIEMMREIGYCSGIENYSRIISDRPAGSAPMTLLDFFPDDFLIIVDESHITIPQIRGMYAGDQSRKTTLVDYGFRLPSAYDNRPLNFDEFYGHINQAVFVSATPGELEKSKSAQIVEQVIRPTGLLDPKILVRPIEGQIDDLIGEIHARTERKQRVLVTTLTKKMAEDLTVYLQKAGIKVRYMHSDIGAMERMEIIRDLRMAKFDVLIGINLLREGLDLPEVSLVAILDADKEGFLRSETSLIQTIGRAARNAEGKVIMYADTVTESMEKAIRETERRREIQDAYNKEHGIVPKTIKKDVRDIIEISSHKDDDKGGKRRLSYKETEEEIKRLTNEMKAASKILEFEHAAYLRDRIKKLREQMEDVQYESKFHRHKGSKGTQP